MKNLEKVYQPKSFEDRIYKKWKKDGYFTAKVNPEKEPYTIVMPPPNVTGKLHLGHAMNNTIQDIIIRHKRMDGFEALWVPGTDHASISTEAKVVNKITSEGKSKESLGREGFLEEAWAWTEEYGGNIKNQLEKLGVSCDWSRDSFTLDENLSRAVTTYFIKLYEDGLIYQGNRIVNWCPSCGTAISDAEVEYEEEEGHLWHIRYPYKDREGYIVIATTRPETLLGDLAVAVNPEDERYKEILGEKLILPLVGREIPVIADDYVDKEYGTGMVKITPSHDPNDFEVGARHDLGQCIVIEEDAAISKGYGRYSGLDRLEARKLIVEDLEKEGLLEKTEHLHHTVGHCERCNETIEPLISKQWFVKMESLAKPALEAYKNGDLNLIPSRFGKVYTNWLENIRDWCISRQLWWGHRLPVYYCEDCGEVIVSAEKPDTCSKCGSSNLIQDPDTLDTWFSSALWAFSTLGWPKDTEDLKYFFPTNTLVTGYDISFFGVIRMVFSTLYNMGELPFTNVYFTGLIRDSQGRKMSKSLGNGIDPIEVIDEYGADALRFTLISGNSPGNDMRFYMEKVESNRNFANKLWNATRFVLMNLDESKIKPLEELELEAEDKWILSRLNTVTKQISQNLEKFEFGNAGNAIYEFIWNEFCDWYIELVKPRLYNDDLQGNITAQSTLNAVLMNIIKLLHPFMPFITEEIYSYLPDKKDMLINESWPKYKEEWVFEKEEEKITLAIDAITSIRNARAELNIPPKKKSKMIFATNEDHLKESFEEMSLHFKTLASAEEIIIEDDMDELENAISLVKNQYKIFIPLEGLIDYQKELDRLLKDQKKNESELKRAEGKLNNESFVKKAPEKLVEEERKKIEKYRNIKMELEESIENLRGKINEL